MYWTLELISYIEDAPFPLTKYELFDYAKRCGAPKKVIENLEELDDDDEHFVYEKIEDVWPECPSQEDYFLFNEEEEEY